MANTKNTVNHIVSLISFLIVLISFFFLIKSGEYRNFIIFALAASSFLLGYFIRRRHDDIGGEDSGGEDEEIKEVPVPLVVKKVPQEFLDEQERYEKLSSENKGEAGQ